MSNKHRLCLLILICMTFLSCDMLSWSTRPSSTIALSSNDVVIEDIAYSEMFNKVFLNLIVNYWDGEGTNYSKASSTGLWLGDHQGDSGTYGPDILFALANDERLLPNRSASDQALMKDYLRYYADRTLEYSMFAIAKLNRFINGGRRPTGGELSAAFGGLIGLSAGYEYKTEPALRDIFYQTTVQFTTLANQFLLGDPELATLGNLLQNLNYSPIMAGGMAAYNMSRFAKANAEQSTYNQDVAMVGHTLDILNTDFWNDAYARYEYEGRAANYSFDQPAATLAHTKYYQLAENQSYLDKAILLGDLTHQHQATNALSYCTNSSLSYLALYEMTGDPKYLQWVAELLDVVKDTLLVDDPYYPGFKIAGHDVERIKPIVKKEGWPDYVSGQPYNWYPGCTGCNHQLCLVIYLYDQYKN